MFDFRLLTSPQVLAIVLASAAAVALALPAPQVQDAAQTTYVSHNLVTTVYLGLYGILIVDM